MLRHWSKFVPNVSTDIRGHEALHHQHGDQSQFVVRHYVWLCSDVDWHINILVLKQNNHDMLLLVLE